jgi:hypothetical protein
VTHQEGGERCPSEAEAGSRGGDHEPENDGLDEEAPPPVLDGQGNRLPGHGNGSRAHGQKDVNRKGAPMASD